VFDRAGTLVHALQLHRGGVCAVSFAQIPNVYTTGGLDGIVRIVNTADPGQPVSLDAGHRAAVFAVSFDPIGRFVASADLEVVNIWKIPEHRLVICYRLVQSPAIGLQWSPSGRFLTVWLHSGKVALIDFEQIC
jgi:WD40 repeat protein